MRNGVERAGRRVVAGDAGRHRPGIEPRAVDGDGHLLGGFVDRDEQVGSAGVNASVASKGDERGSKAAATHDEPLGT